MTKDEWERAFRLFEAVRQNPESEIPGILASSQETDHAVIAAAIRMLESFHRQDHGDIEIPGSELKLPESAGDREGSAINGWLIGRSLGAGGSGRVYLAERPSPRGAEMAAIKFLDHAVVDTKRFQRERQLLADLDHEGIAKFIEGGTTARGVPYLVMEYIPGLPITNHCELQKFPITKRLGLFVSLCRAVEYAHDHRVIHRDLKPLNILVTSGPKGSVRVLDFGIAKLLEPTHAGEPAITRADQALWTREYAAPEQVDGGDVSFATDVYALGLLLYELVTGGRPFSDFALSGTDWRQVICERDPIPPSAAMKLESRDPETIPPQTQSTRYRGRPSRLERAMAGDLDAVILKALEKSPGKRYQRVDQFRQQIERIRNGLPVDARTTGWFEKLFKWSLMNPRTAAALVVGVLWTATVLHLGALQYTDYNAQLENEARAVRRFRYLTEEALPGVEKALQREPRSDDARLTLTRVQSGLLKQVEALPEVSRRDLDWSIASSAKQCARQFQELGEPGAALDVIDPVLPRAAWHYDWDPDRRWTHLYPDLLRQRIEIDSSLGRDTSEDARLLARIGNGSR